MAQREASLPSHLRLGPTTGSLEAEVARRRAMVDQGGPAAEARANEFMRGDGNSFASQRTAQLQGELAIAAQKAADDAQDRAYQRTIAARQAYMGGMPSFAADDSDYDQYEPPQRRMLEPQEPSRFERGVQIAKGVDNFLGGALSGTLSRIGHGVGNAVSSGANRIMNSRANPFASFFQQQYEEPFSGYGGYNFRGL